jgi:zinc protease
MEQQRKVSQASDEKLFDYQQITLDNGLEVITLEDFSCPIVSVQVWYQVGSKDEQPDRQGYAHMFEHMMFKGTDRVSEKDHFNLIRKVGGTCNAYTSFDKTVYYETLPADQVELGMWLEAERMSFLTINQESFDTERNVVEEELRMGQNKPYGTLFKKVFANMFDVHPYQWTPIGSLAHLRATSVADLRAFWKKYYLPNNATLIVVGAIEHDKAQQLADEYFGWISAGATPPRITAKEPALKKTKQVVIDDENAPAGQVAIGWRTVPGGTRDEIVLDCLSQILGGGNSSRMYRALVADTQAAVDTMTWSYNLQQDGLFMAEATLAPNADNYETLLEALKKQIVTLQKDGVTDEELEKARNQMLKSMVTTNLTIQSKASLLGNAALTMGDVSKANTMIETIRSVTKKDIRKAAVTYLNTDRMYEFIIKQNTGMQQVKTDNEDAPITAEPELKAPPAGRAGLQRPDEYPQEAPLASMDDVSIELNFTEDALDNGLKVMTVPNSEVPFVSVMLGLTNGAWTEVKPATAAITLSMLTKGTARHSEAELAAELERYAISLSAGTDEDTSKLSMNCLTEQLDRGMGLLAEVVLEPTFDQGEFDKLLKQEITGLEIQSQQPRYLASKYFNQVLFGDHPYSRTVKGDVADLKALTPDDLKLWWSKFARPDQATLIFAGDINQQKAMELAQQYLGSWKTDLVETGIMLADIPQAKPTKIYIVNRPGSVQAQIHVGQIGITRHQQPDYFTGLIAGNYFGGSFHSRLNENLRVKRGLTYGAWGSFRPKAKAGTFEISTFTKNESAAESVKVILELIEEFQTVEPTDAEFYDTKSAITGSFARNRETPQDVAGDLWMIESQHLEKDYFENLFTSLANTSKQDCLELTNNRLDVDKQIIVIIGDAEVLMDELAPLAPVQVIETGE